MSESALRALSEFVTPGERMARGDVRGIARRCAGTLRAALTDPDVALTDVTGAFNKGSLMFALAGDMDEAERSCRRQIAVLGCALEDPRTRLEAAANLLRPWVNIGRLRLRQGRWREALAYFTAVRALLDREPVEVDGAGLSRVVLAELAARPWYPQVRFWARYVLIRDVTEAHLRGGAAGELAAVAAGWRTDPEFAAMPLATEARAMVDTHGADAGAWSLAGRVRQLRAAGLRSGADLALAVHDGFRAPAGSYPAGHAAADVALAVGLPADLEHAAMLLRLGQLAQRCGHPGEAARCLRRVLAIATAAGDEPLQVDVADALLAGEPADREVLAARVAGLEAGSLYFPVRRRAGGTPLRTADVPELADLGHTEQAVVERFTAARRPMAER